MKTRMIAFDTSTTKSGYACFENGILVEKGVIDCSKEKDTMIRIENMCLELVGMLKKTKPDIVVVEKPPFINSPQTLIQLSEIVGCCKGWAITQGYSEFIEYMPNEWRALVKRENEKIPRKREECKAWDIDKVYEYMPNIEDITDDNEADAILIGIARMRQFMTAENGVQKNA